MDKDTPISELLLPTRPRRALEALGVDTVRKLLSLDLDKVPYVRRMGDRTKKQLAAIRERIAYELGSSSGRRHDSLSPRAWDILLGQLSVRTRNGLNALGISTPEAFLELTRDRFLSVRAIGRTSWNEVSRTQKQMKRRSSTLHGSFVPDGPGGRDPKRLSPAQAWNLVLRQLSTRTINGLKTLEISTPEAFLELTEERFLSIPAIGRTSWNEVFRSQKQLVRYSSVSHDSCPPDGLDARDEKRLLSLVRRELGKDHHILDSLSIQSFGELLDITYEEVTALDGVGAVKWHRLQEVIQKAPSSLSSTAPASDGAPLNDFPLYAGSCPSSVPVPESFHPTTPIESVALPARCKSVLETLGLRTLSAVLLASPEHLLNQNNFGEQSLYRLRRAIRDYLDYRNTWDGVVDTGSSLSAFIRNLCALSDQPKDTTRILLERLRGLSGKPRSNAVLARAHGYSTTAIGNMLTKTVNRIKQHFQSKVGVDQLRETLRTILDEFRGIIDWDTLGRELVQRMHWETSLPHECLRTLFRYFFDGAEFSIATDRISVTHICRECDVVVGRIHHILSTTKGGVLSFPTLAERITPCMTETSPRCAGHEGMKFSQPFLEEQAKRAGLFCDESDVYSDRGWALHKGGLSRKVDAHMDMLGRETTPQQLWIDLCPFLDRFVSPEQIHDILIRTESTVMWGRGVFIHKNHIQVQRRILSSLRDLLLLRLRTVPFVALHGLFDELRVTLTKAGIPNEYALCTVVSLYLDDVHVDRYRYVHMKKPPENIAIGPYIEQWVLEQDGEVKTSDVERWMLENVGIRKSLVRMSLSKLHNIIATRKGHCVHIDNTGLAADALDPLLRWVEAKLVKHSHIGVGLLFKEQRVTCFRLGIRSERMLYSVLRHFFSREFDCSRPPHIRRQDESSLKTLPEALSGYVREQGTIVAVEECIEQFAKRGYSPGQMRARLPACPDIVSYYTGCVVHLNTIGWSGEHSEQLRQVLSGALALRRKCGHLMGDLQEVYDLQEDRLPALATGFAWTRELLASLTSRCEDVKLLGNAKRAYVLTSHKDGIGDLGALVVRVVRDVFKGGCSREQIGQWMRENGVVRKRLTPQMFSAPSGLVMTEYECFWEGNSNG